MMFSSDLPFILTWWLTFFLIGIVFLPLTMFIFAHFLDRGYIFSKILGMLLISYTLFTLGTLQVLPFTYTAIIFTLVIWVAVSFAILIKVEPSRRFNLLKNTWKFFIFEEVLFFIALSFWSYVRAHEPSIHGLEKFMDFGFVNSILRGEFFPAKDVWLTPSTINYYYFGHLVTAVLTKLSGIDPAVTYNLMIAMLFAFTFMGAFSIGANLIDLQLKAQSSKLKAIAQNLKIIIVGGLLAGFLVALAGNLHTIYAFFNAYDGENPVPFWTLALDFDLLNYWYPNATRFISLTIHEFPIYSFVVSDLHGHVLSIPIVLTIIAVLLSLIFKFQFSNFNFQIILLSFLLAVAYMTNAWDGIIYAVLTGLVFIYLAYRSKDYTLLSAESKLRLYAIRYTLVIIGSIVFSLPFSLHFKPFVSGIGVICAPEFLTKIGSFGPFLFEAEHCQRSPLWQLLILHGFWYFWVIAFIFSLRKKMSSVIGSRFSVFGLRFVGQSVSQTDKQRTDKLISDNRQLKTDNGMFASDLFVLILIGLSTLLLILPEFVYAKDIYPAHYRANTMFKLGYSAFMMLGISSAYIIVRIFNFQLSIFKNIYLKLGYWVIGIIGLFLIGIYSFFAINSYYGGLRVYRGLDGLAYLQNLYPTDYEAILWIRQNINGQPVILEAAGESYTDYARISANTGLPTVVGWPVHEWLWRGSYDEAGKRVLEVERLYTTTAINEAKRLLETYNVEYVFVGDLERQKYPVLHEEKFKKLGTPIFEKGDTVIYQLHSRLE